MTLAVYADFTDRFPEFSQVTEDQVEDFLALAAESVAAAEWTGLATSHQFEGHLYLTAHLLAQSPNGNNARKDDKSGDAANTTYGARYDELRTMIACGVRVF